jgi:hypothetical protein
MIRAALVAAALLGPPALAAEGGPILGGEHVGFSRLVLEIEPGSDWSLETAPGRAALVLPGRAVEFATDGTFEKLPKTRIQAVRPLADGAGTRVEVDISCDCLVSALLVGTRFVALDVADPGVVPPGVEAAAQRPLGEPAPAPETAEARAEREEAAVASAEQILIQQIERAASQGLIELAEPEAGEKAAEAAEAAPAALPDPAAEPPAPPPAPPAAEGAPAMPARA